MAEEAISLGERFRRLAAEKAERPAVTCDGETVSWASLERRSNRIARGLAARGVAQGDLVTIALPNGTAFVEATVALWKLGAVPQPISAKLPQAELEGVLALADPPLVFADATLRIDRPVVSAAALVAETENDQRLPDRIAPAWKAPTSGGSTGRPKLIIAGQPGVVNPFDIDFWRIDNDGVSVMPGPLYHNGPFVSAMTSLIAGAHLMLLPKFDAQATLELVEQHRATWLYLVPAMMGRIWRLPSEIRGRVDLSSLKTVWHLAAPCPPWLKQAWIEWLGPEVIWELYGGTEAQAGTVISGSEWLTHRGSVGRAAFGEIRVLDERGAELPRGEIGEVYLRRSVGTPPSYRYVGASARTLGDWESLGDFGWMDDEGYLYLTDRRTDMILVGGANVYPAEVEAALDAHPAVISSAVIGLPDEDLGARVRAIVQGRPDLDLGDLAAHLAQQLAPYKRPKSFELVDVPLRDDAGKVRRSQLRQERFAIPSKQTS
jgi:bile acid-coenzyme A ligase